MRVLPIAVNTSYRVPFTLVLLLAMFLHASQQVKGQVADSIRLLTGTVSDAATGEPVPGATVLLRTTDSSGGTSDVGSTVTNGAGNFRLQVPAIESLSLRISSIGYQSTQVPVTETDKELRVWLVPRSTEDISDKVAVVGVRRTRSVEDGCCRVESIREEVQQHAPFSPSPVESLRRYSSCTSGRVINTIDGAGTISLRGLEPTRVGLTLDDAPLFTGLSRFYGLGIVPSHALQTIRIIEGASDARYGNGVISGVVNFETRPPTEEQEVNASISLSGESIEPDQVDVNASYTGLIGDVGLAAFGSYNRHSSLLPDLGGTLDRDYERMSALIKGNLLIDDLTEMTVTLLGGEEERDGSVVTDGEADYRQSLRLRRFDGIVTLARTVGTEGELKGTGAISRLGALGNFGPHPIDATQTTAWGELRLTGFAGDHSYAVGVQGRSDVMAAMQTAPGSTLDYDVSIFSLYAQDAIALSEKWTVLGSVRADRHSWGGTNVAPRGSLRFAPSESVSMRLMAGGGVKGEALFDEEYRTLTGAYRWLPNRDLGFERSWTFNYDISWDVLIGDKVGLNTNLNAYYTAINGRHMAQPDSLARGVYFAVNDNRAARLTGMEWQLRGTVGENWSGSFAVAFIDYSTVNVFGEREQVPLAPRLNLDASLMYRNEEAGFVAEIWGSRIGAQSLPILVNGLDKTTPYVIVNGRVEKSLGPVAIFVGLLNGLDERQIELMPLVQRSGEVPDGGIAWGMAEGREFFAGLRVRL